MLTDDGDRLGWGHVVAGFPVVVSRGVEIFFHDLRSARESVSSAHARWAGGVDLSMMPEAGALDPVDETCREYERVIDPKYLDQIRASKRRSFQTSFSRGSREWPGPRS
jgi:hypothetical protein